MLILVGIATFTNLDSPWMSDDGAYASQVTLAERGDWGYRDAPSWGTSPSSVPTLGKSTVIDGIEYPYVKHPTWIHVLLVAKRVDLPIVGMFAVNVLAAVVTASVAGHLAGFRRRTGIIAFWAVALGPLLVWSLGAWAHAVACALGGIVAWSLVRWREREGLWWIALAASALGCLVLVRTEGILLVAGVGAALVLHLWERRQDRRAVTRVGIAGLVVVGAAGLAKVIDLWLIRAVAPGTGQHVPSSGHPWVTGRISGFEATFLSGGFTEFDYLSGLVALVLVVAGAGLWTRRPDRALGTVVVFAGVAVVAIRAIAGWDHLIQGMFAAAPVLAFGLVGVRWTRASIMERTLSVFAAAYALAVVMTQYPEGGATEWGGRFLAPIIVPLGVLAALAIGRLVERAGRDALPHRKAVLAVVALLIALPVVPALGSTNSNRARHAAIAADLRAAGVDAAIATYPTLPLLLWPTVGEVPWTVTGIGADEQLPALVERARAAGEKRLAVVGYTVDPAIVGGLGFRVEQMSRHLLVLTIDP